MIQNQEPKDLHQKWREYVEKQLLENRKIIVENTRLTLETKQGVDEVVDILKAAKGAIKVLGWVAVIAKWLGVLAAAGSAIYLMWHQITHGGQLPK